MGVFLQQGGHTMGERKLDKKELEMSDLEMVDFIVGAQAHVAVNLKIRGKRVLSWIEEFKLAGVKAPEEIKDNHYDDPYIKYMPPRPPQADDQYKDYDQKMVKDLKRLKFNRWDAKKRGNWAAKLEAWIQWRDFEAPKDLKNLVDADHILSDPYEESEEYERPDYLNELIKKLDENNEE